VERYVAAWERNDVDAVVAMLAEDARMAMPPRPTWFRGRQQIGMFLRTGPLGGARRWRLIRARANGQLAFGCYFWDEETQAFPLHGVNVLTLRGPQIEETTTFLSPGVFRRFGLPDRLYSSSFALCASSATCSDVRDSAESRSTPRIRSICCSRW
jgi:hypothetical protein